MADINQVITLGIGTPAGIKEFLTFGLQIGVAVVVQTWTKQNDVSTTYAAQSNIATTWIKQSDESDTWTVQ